jgi:hypothetical protein
MPSGPPLIMSEIEPRNGRTNHASRVGTWPRARSSALRMFVTRGGETLAAKQADAG